MALVFLSETAHYSVDEMGLKCGGTWLSIYRTLPRSSYAELLQGTAAKAVRS